MEIKRFGLGIRFDVMAGEDEQPTPEQLWEEVFSVLTTSDTKGMLVYGGHTPYASEDSCYICVFTNGSLKEMRRIYHKLNEDAGVNMYLTATHPFIQSNALGKIDGLTFYGKVQSDGSLTGGDEPLGVLVCKKRGKRRPVGKGIVFLLAPGAYGEFLTSKKALRRLTIAARKNFKGVRILPLPIADGGPGTVDALLTACNGIRRTVQVKGPDGSAVQAHYAVLKGKAAVIEMPAAYAEEYSPEDQSSSAYFTSFGLGELMRRAMDEGLTTIVLGCPPARIHDWGLGCLRAFGVKLLDSEGHEIENRPDEWSKLYELDTELMHPRIRQTRFILMSDCNASVREAKELVQDTAKGGHGRGFAHYLAQIAAYSGKNAAEMPGSMAANGLALSLMGFCDAKWVWSIDALLAAAEMPRRIQNISLVIAGEGYVDESSLQEGGSIGALARLCDMHKVPLALLAGVAGEDAQTLLERYNCSLFEMPVQSLEDLTKENAMKLYDSAADRMFRFIRLGRDIERISARKSKS